MSDHLKQIWKPVGFLLIFSLLFLRISSILQEKYVAYDSLGETLVNEQFNALEPDSIELAFLGSSQIVRDISCMHLLETYNISAFSSGTGSQPMMCTCYYAERLLKTQQLKAAVIDVSSLFEKVTEPSFRSTADFVPWSAEKAELLRNYAKYIRKKNGLSETIRSFWSYLFPIMQFHDRWSQLTDDDFNYRNSAPFVFRGNATRIYRLSFDGFIIDRQKIDPDVHPVKNQLKYFRKTLELFQEAGVPVLLIKTPKLDWTLSKSQCVKELADEYGVNYLDFNTQELFDAVGFDTDADLADQEHLNFAGAFKLTDYLADYLSGQVNFSKTAYTEKDKQDLEAYHRLLRKDTMMLTENPEELLACAQDDDCTMLVTAGRGAGIPDSLKESFAEMGFHTDLWGTDCYAGLMSGGAVIFEKTSEKKLKYDTILPNQMHLQISGIQYTPEIYMPSIKLTDDPDEEPQYLPADLHIVVFADRYPALWRSVTLTADQSGIHMR